MDWHWFVQMLISLHYHYGNKCYEKNISSATASGEAAGDRQ